MYCKANMGGCTMRIQNLQVTVVFKTLQAVAMWDCDKCDKALAVDEDMWLESTDFDADAYSFCTSCWQNSQKTKTPLRVAFPISLSRCGLLHRRTEQQQSPACATETRSVLLPNRRGTTPLTCRFISGSARSLAEHMVTQ